jgi:predicted oxidoreductase (fatty acid repression mutant protein)
MKKKIKETLNIPKDWQVVALVTLGYPSEQPKPKKKKSIEELFNFNSFHG